MPPNALVAYTFVRRKKSLATQTWMRGFSVLWLCKSPVANLCELSASEIRNEDNRIGLAIEDVQKGIELIIAEAIS